MNPSLIMSFVVTMIVSAILIPLVMKAGKELGIVAHKNKRTVHKVKYLESVDMQFTSVP